jgi:acyl-CoA reductase-like NAD-dependent aldehyde dehydrogenase
VLGGPEVGQALVAARPDTIFFTGSVATGRRVMAAAAEHLIPVTLELGGKDPMIVFADATFERAVAGAAYGAFTNAGQTCVAIERAYVEEPIYESFVDAVTEAAGRLRVGSEGDVGPIINPAQCTTIDAHVDDALERGARLTTERRREGSFYHPMVLRDVDHSMSVMTEETFGPVLPVMPFATEREAIELANDSCYGLNASVWTVDIDRARRVATSLVTGNCAINDVLTNIANPHMPFGGEKHSGMGRYHGPEGLRAFSRQKSVMVYAGRRAREINWFPYTPVGLRGLKAMIRALYEDKPVLGKARGMLGELLGRFGPPKR